MLLHNPQGQRFTPKWANKIQPGFTNTEGGFGTRPPDTQTPNNLISPFSHIGTTPAMTKSERRKSLKCFYNVNNLRLQFMPQLFCIAYACIGADSYACDTCV